MHVICFVYAQDSDLNYYFPTCSDKEWNSTRKLESILKRFLKSHKRDELTMLPNEYINMSCEFF